MNGLHLGALAEPIKKQIPSLNKRKASLFQKIADSITMLAVHGYLTEGQTIKLRDKLVKEINKELEKQQED